MGFSSLPLTTRTMIVVDIEIIGSLPKKMALVVEGNYDRPSLRLHSKRLWPAGYTLEKPGLPLKRTEI